MFYTIKKIVKGIPWLRKPKINCPVSATLKLIGGKYKSLILWHLMRGTMRYGEIQRLIPEATPKMLTQRLELENDGLLVRTVYPVVPPKWNTL